MIAESTLKSSFEDTGEKICTFYEFINKDMLFLYKNRQIVPIVK